MRDANAIAIPNQYIAKDYVPPSFRVSATGGQSAKNVQNPWLADTKKPGR